VPTSTIPVPMRLDPDIRQAGMARAKSLRRTFTAYVEYLIARDLADATKEQAPRRTSKPARAD